MANPFTPEFDRDALLERALNAMLEQMDHFKPTKHHFFRNMRDERLAEQGYIVANSEEATHACAMGLVMANNVRNPDRRVNTLELDIVYKATFGTAMSIDNDDNGRKYVIKKLVKYFEHRDLNVI